ncbi:MAG: SGNH/GDSL hydrolase family protein [Acidisphaera sp.]|nr:SGNH/GDSL hydrolase family protein [Acidisphaera sp.]
MAQPFLTGYLGYGVAGATGGFSELPASNGYARRPISFSPIDYGRTRDTKGGTLGPCQVADFGMLSYGAVFDAPVAGNLLLSFPLPNPAYVAVGGTRTDATGTYAFRFPDLDLAALPRTTLSWPAGTQVAVLDGTALPVISGVPLTVAGGVLAANLPASLRQSGGSSSVWLPIGFRARGAPGSGYNETNAANSSFQDVTVWSTPASASVKALRLCYPGFDVTASGEADRAITVTGAASIQYNGLVYPAKFGGHRQMLIEPMHDMVVSDPIAVSLPPGVQFAVRTWGQVSGGSSWWLADYATPTSGTTRLAGEANARGTSLADHTLTTTTPSNSGGGYWGPVTVLALLSAPSAAVLVLGDSIAGGTGDAADANGRMGFIQRGLANSLPWASLARGSTTAAQAVAAGNGRGMYAAAVDRGITDVLLQWCRNDLNNGATAVQTRSSLQALAAPYLAAGIRVWVFTCPPTTTSSDAWASAANQSIPSAANETQRTAYNSDLRLNWRSYGFAGLVDIAGLLEDPANPGRWQTAGGAWTADGVHPTPSGHNALIAAGMIAPGMFVL